MSTDVRKPTHPFLKNRNIAFRQRLGPDPHANGATTVALDECPDIWETESGDFAVIGIRITETSKSQLPQTASCGPDEEIVLVPRTLLISAKADIPDIR
jgi:hypothetical protein